ncbi:transmembrane protein 203-like [Corticium candelabrum]|uniref:transmembrane protein 203-like n=1 Tax=Corticium candelabrum TaxID=121492 RepID=UPI002E255153|nr:transmembrane protein 203-like [Corticium candelabrum]
MLFSLKETSRWLGLSPFEIWIHLVCTCVFSVLVPLKVDGVLSTSTSWWQVFSPLFISDAVTGYFTVIVFIRLYMSHHVALAASRSVWSGVLLLLFSIFKLLVCLRLEQISQVSYATAMTPIFIALGLLAIRGCYVNDNSD